MGEDKPVTAHAVLSSGTAYRLPQQHMQTLEFRGHAVINMTVSFTCQLIVRPAIQKTSSSQPKCHLRAPTALFRSLVEVLLLQGPFHLSVHQGQAGFPQAF